MQYTTHATLAVVALDAGSALPSGRACLPCLLAMPSCLQVSLALAGVKCHCDYAVGFKNVCEAFVMPTVGNTVVLRRNLVLAFFGFADVRQRTETDKRETETD